MKTVTVNALSSRKIKRSVARAAIVTQLKEWLRSGNDSIGWRRRCAL